MVREVFRSLFSSQPVRISPPQAKTPIGEDHAPTKAEMSLSFVATVMGASRIFPRRLSLSRQPFPKTMVEKKSQNRSCSETSSPFAPTAFLGFERSASPLPERPSQAISLASYGTSFVHDASNFFGRVQRHNCHFYCHFVPQKL